MQEVQEMFEEYPWALIMFKIIFSILVTNLVASVSRRIWNRNPNNNHFLFRKFVYNMMQTVIYLVGILITVSQIPMLSSLVKTILAGSGILALALSLSAQESLNNIISGLFITLFKPFEVGDRVTLVNSKLTGTIEDITLRHTIIKTFTNTRVVMPNATINKEVVENSNLIDSRASSYVDVWVAYESDIDKAIELMAEVIGNHPYYLDVRSNEDRDRIPKVKVYVRELGDSGISLRASMWTKTVNENFDACSDVRLQIKKAFDAAGVEIPYTKYTILHQNSSSETEGNDALPEADE